MGILDKFFGGLPGPKSVKFPWEPDRVIEANLAIGNMRESLLNWLEVDGRIHTETMMLVTGALAGAASQNAVWERYVKSGEPIPQDGFVAVETQSGERFYFGNLLNYFLVPEAGNDTSIWSFVGAGAVESGVPQAQLPDFRPIFEHKAATIGTPDFEILRVPEEHQPHLTPRTALERFWLPTRSIFARKEPRGQVLAPAHWPVVLGIVAQQFIRMSTDVLDPRVSVRLVMESAIISSKFDIQSLSLSEPK